MQTKANDRFIAQKLFISNKIWELYPIIILPIIIHERVFEHLRDDMPTIKPPLHAIDIDRALNSVATYGN